jgi:putative oxidoreductase
MSGVDVAILVLRLAVGGTMIAHGCNHAFGGGRLAGTAGWFESIGIRPGRLHAVLATLVELGAGAMLVVGLLTPLAAAGVVGTMGVALVANHMHNGFFVFRPGEGYEYVLNLIVAAIALGGLGGGAASIDHVLAVDLNAWIGLAVAGGAGGFGAALLLAVFWRPAPREQAAETNAGHTLEPAG